MSRSFYIQVVSNFAVVEPLAVLQQDLTLWMVIDRHIGLPLSKWRGDDVDFFSGLMGM